MFFSNARMGQLYLQMITATAGPARKRKQRYGRALTIALFLAALSACVFGRGALR